MGLPLFLQGLGSIGVFTSRAFLPAFVTALLLRFGPQVPWLAHTGLLAHVRDVPIWFTSNPALAVLGILTALELLAERVPEAQAPLDAAHDFLKSGMAILTYMGVLSATDQGVARAVVHQAGVGDTVPALAVGAAVFVACRARAAVLGPLIEADEDDDLGLRGILRWIEDVWSGLGPVALIVLPLLTVAVFVLAATTLLLVERYLEARGDRATVPCASCGQPIHACAPICPLCRTPVKEPRDVGLLGQPLSRPASLSSLPYRLVAVKRCPMCATRLRRKAVKQTCEACGHLVMADPEFARAFIATVDRRVPLTLAICFMVGLIPVLGVVPGLIYYRFALVAPFRRYMPAGQRFLLRWGVRLAVVLLAAVQWVPVAGGLAIPTMALISYAAYRTAYRRMSLAT